MDQALALMRSATPDQDYNLLLRNRHGSNPTAAPRAATVAGMENSERGAGTAEETDICTCTVHRGDSGALGFAVALSPTKGDSTAAVRAHIKHVEPAVSAATGLQPGDQIMEIDGVVTKADCSAASLIAALSGQSVTLTVRRIRSGRPAPLPATRIPRAVSLGKATPKTHNSEVENTGDGSPVTSTFTLEIDRSQRPRRPLGIGVTIRGKKAYVSKVPSIVGFGVAPGRLRVGDCITKINDINVHGTRGLSMAMISRALDCDRLSLSIERPSRSPTADECTIS